MVKTARRNCPCCGQAVTEIPVRVAGVPEVANPVMAGARRILVAFGVCDRQYGWTLHDVAKATNGAASAGAVHDILRGRNAPKSIRVLDAVLNAFGFELAIRKIPERPSSRIEPMVGAD